MPTNTHGMDKAHSISWHRPNKGTMVLNVDGSALTNPGKAGFGGLVCDCSGAFLLGFYGSAGETDILHAEVLALLRGLSLCWDAGYRSIVCYSNSLVTVKLVSDGVHLHHREANEVKMIQQLMSRDWSVYLNHSWGEANQCADFLAKLGAHTVEPLIVLHAPPQGLSPHLLADAMGVSFPRG